MIIDELSFAGVVVILVERFSRAIFSQPHPLCFEIIIDSPRKVFTTSLYGCLKRMMMKSMLN